MDLTGEYRIPAPRDKVWEALNDPEILKQCIDGCEELNKEDDQTFTAKVTTKVGPVKAKFSGKVTLSNIDAPNGYTISGEGQGGVAGFAKGSADVHLTEDGSDTVLNYKAKADVGGKLASIGSRMVEGVAKKTADSFFSQFSQIVGGAPASGGTASGTEPPASTEQPQAEQQPQQQQSAASAATPQPAAAGGAAAAAQVAPAQAAPAKPAGVSPWIWGVGLVVAVGILWLVFGG